MLGGQRAPKTVVLIGTETLFAETRCRAGFCFGYRKRDTRVNQYRASAEPIRHYLGEGMEGLLLSFMCVSGRENSSRIILQSPPLK